MALPLAARMRQPVHPWGGRQRPASSPTFLQDSLPAATVLFFFNKMLREGDGELNFLSNPNQRKVKSILPHQFCFHCC